MLIAIANLTVSQQTVAAHEVYLIISYLFVICDAIKSNESEVAQIHFLVFYIKQILIALRGTVQIIGPR